MSPAPEPLTLSHPAGEGAICFADRAPADMAWYDVRWRANVDLQEFSFEISGAEGVTQVGAARTVPPRNFGGRIDASGIVSWKDHPQVLRRNPHLSGGAVESTLARHPIAGETGMVVLRLRMDPDVLATDAGARFDGVHATYTTGDGEQGQTQVATQQVFKTGRCS
ncbi:hypothetical protein [Nocardioides sp.]|uniref:hypothetical protein n=1 Tax=Nocardioides sp. TaxID=35761 RepID=UPI002732F91D|nr:hypothetical protein [Nocardioides sp.]MDP3894003.1 hypothetical protein [Nocardioides sp.]